jgi:signal transduction histidine kinase/ligand-binding sensor domain-containing protein
MYPLFRAALKWAVFTIFSWVGIALFLGGSTVATAQPVTQPYYVHVWQTEDGLPQNAVPAILQTADGYLWVCTFDGLARFDGVHFTVFNNANTPGLANNRVTSLFEDVKEDLWIGHETGELTLYHDGKFEPVKFNAVWRNRSIDAIETDEEGDIWLQNADRQLARLSDGTVLMPQKGDLGDYGTLTKGDQGFIWALNAGRVSMLKGGKLLPVDFDAATPNTHVQGIAHSRRGGVWVASDGRLRRWDGNRWIEDLGSSPWGTGELAAFIETRNGYLAAATLDQTGQGLYLISPKGEVTLFNRANGFSSDWLRCLCEDREGNLWVGSGNGGLAMVRHSEITTVNTPDNWQGRAVLSVCTGTNNTLWIGTEGAGIYEFHAGKWEHYDESNGLLNMYIWSISEDIRGQLWAGSWGNGLFVKEGEHFANAAATANLMIPITALLPSKFRGLWAGTGVGLLRLKEDGSATWFGKSKDLPWPQVRAVLEDGTNRVWFGTTDSGLGCLENGNLRQFRKRDGLSDEDINCLHLDSDGVLWIGTAGGGINRLKHGHLVSVTTQQGLPNDVICDIEDDGHGYFWISSHGGIFRVSRDKLNEFMDGLTNSIYCRIYGKGDGLPTLECSGGFQPASCQTDDGRIWFPTSHGLVVIYPYDVRSNQLAPPVTIEKLIVDNHSVNLAVGTSPLRITPGRHRFEFFYTGLSFVVPEKVQFKYELEGLEKSWVNAGTMRSVAYNYIPPGKYVFHVTACNNDGVWNETGVKLPFTVLPFFWQTLWFQVAACITAAVAVGSIVWLDTRHRMQRKLERVERLRAVERERNRIARDIHDHLGAGLTHITFLSQIVRKRLNEPEQATLTLNHLHNTVRKITRDMDEIVWAVNPQHDTLDSLVTYLGKFAQEFIQATGIRCRLDLPFQLPAWPLTAEVRHNLFLSFKEALNNAVGHAVATQVDVSIVIRLDGFTLSVKDNGCGFDPKLMPWKLPPSPDRLSHGNGLINMHQRLAEIGGRFDIQSEPGKGTTVIFNVPVKGITP